MATCTLSQITTSTTTTSSDVLPDHRGLRRSFSAMDLQGRSGIRRSHSDNHLCYSFSPVKAKLKSSRSVGFFNIQYLSSAVIPDTLKSFLFDTETSEDMKMEGLSDHDHGDQGDEEIEGSEGRKRASWMERLMELRDNWRGKEEKVDGGSGENSSNINDGGCDEEGGCDVEYDNDVSADGVETTIDKETFSSLLRQVSWSDTKMFSQMAFLCNMAYAITDMKTGDLRRYYGLDLVTSSLEKKAQAEAIKDKVEQDCTRVAIEDNNEQFISSRICSSNAYEIAASAASYVQWRANEDQEMDESGGGTTNAINKSDKMAARVAASTMTAVVAAGVRQREKAATDLQSLQSSPCEWFVCDDPSVYTRCFVIQGSDSLASWQANLFFEPTKFEETNVLVHRGIYEAAKGIYDQFMPEIKQHLIKYGDRAKLQFTGHSLGGSLALLVNLMLLTRNEVKSTSLLPVVTFGSPFVFCGGQKILDELRLDEDCVHCVMMHRDIVPRAFSCNYPDYVAQVLKRLNGTFRFHPCLNKNKLLYSPMGKLFILQPDEKSSPHHPLLPPGTGLYTLNNTNTTLTRSAILCFLNSPHPIETLSERKAYGSEGTIRRDHDSSNYLKAVNEVIRQHTRLMVRKARKQRSQLWPLLASRSPHAWRHTCNVEGSQEEANGKLLSGV